MTPTNSRLIIGIDLGNTNTSLAYRLGDEKPRLLPIDDDPEKPNSLRNVLRSAVLFPYDTSQPSIVGRRALDLAHETGWLFKDYKKSLLNGGDARSHYHGLHKGPKDALVEVLRDLRHRLAAAEPSHFQRAERDDLQGLIPVLPPFITLGVPAETPDTYKALLKGALAESGWYADEIQADSNLSFLPEPIAPLLLLTPDPDKWYLAFDFGGLTLDIALAKASKDSEFQYEILKTVRCVHGGSDIGGTLLDRLIMRMFAEDDEIWLELLGSAEEYYGISADPDKLRQMSRGEIDWVNDGTDEGEFFKFLSVDVENFRIALSERAKAKLILNSFSSSAATRKAISDDLDRDDFERDVLENPLNSIEVALNGILVDERGISVKKDDVMVVPAGGVSLTPGIVAYLRQYYGSHNVRPPQDFSPLETIAVGCAKFTPAGLIEMTPVRVNARTDTDYGVWDAGYGRWSVIVPEGTEYVSTKLPQGLPKPGEGISETYRLTHKSSSLRVKVGQRLKSKGIWDILGVRDIQINQDLGEFQVYFEIDQNQGVLEMSIIHNQRRLPLTEPKFKTRN